MSRCLSCPVIGPAAQLAVIAGATLTLIAPPDKGAMLLVPIHAEASQRVVAIAVDRGALLVGRGPIPGSVVVAGRRAAMLGSLLRAGVLVFAAPPAGCGATA